jgi:hypothetical protein
MGTSTSQPSPPGPDWQTVRRGYSDPALRAPDAVSRIVQAMDDQFVAGLSSAPVARALRSLMDHGAQVAGAAGDQARLLGVAQSIREEVQDVTAVRRDSSRFGELAVAAATRTVLASSSRPPGVPLSRAFVATYLSQVFAHLVARDVSRAMGTGQFTGIVETRRFMHAAEAHVAAEVEPLEVGALEGAEGEDEIAAVLSRVVPRALEHLVLEEGEDAA